MRLTALQATFAGAVALLAGAIAGWAVEFDIGFVALLLAFAYGILAGDTVLKAAKRRRGTALELIASIGIAGGALGGRLVVAALMLASPGSVHPPGGVFSVLTSLATPSPIPIIALAAVIAGALSRIRRA